MKSYTDKFHNSIRFNQVSEIFILKFLLLCVHFALELLKSSNSIDLWLAIKECTDQWCGPYVIWLTLSPFNCPCGFWMSPDTGFLLIFLNQFSMKSRIKRFGWDSLYQLIRLRFPWLWLLILTLNNFSQCALIFILHTFINDSLLSYGAYTLDRPFLHLFICKKFGHLLPNDQFSECVVYLIDFPIYSFMFFT